MTIRLAAPQDIGEISDIFNSAREFLFKQNINQWQDDYPNEIDASLDIENKCCYVIQKDKTIAICMTLVFSEEPTYKNIYQGAWLNEGRYGVIHRMAANASFKGRAYAKEMFEEKGRELKVSSLRIDTHKDNKPMLKALKKASFEYCGIIYVQDNTQRLAFEKLI